MFVTSRAVVLDSIIISTVFTFTQETRLVIGFRWDQMNQYTRYCHMISSLLITDTGPAKKGGSSRRRKQFQVSGCFESE